MSPIQATADSIRAAVRSTSTCTPSTAATLSDLLLPKANNDSSSAEARKIAKPPVAPNAKTGKASTAARTKKAQYGERTKKEHEDECHLSPRERSILATEVINSTLKSLSEAIKAPTAGPLRRQASSRDLVKASARKALRRSNSAPQSPLQSRSLNRVSTSPILSSRPSRSSSSVSAVSSGQRSSAECARVAFACLRALQAAKLPGVDLPPLQLENGMSVLVGKLISLGLDDLAIKELRILKRRLEIEAPSRKAKTNATISPLTLTELLDFGGQKLHGPKLGLVISTQLQVLRLLTTSKKHQTVGATLSILNPSHVSSPTKLLLLAAEESETARKKSAHQLQTLSDILLSMCPSVSPTDDVIALEPRLSVTAEVAFRLQVLALRNRILWWKLASHSAGYTKDILDPFLRCLSTFARRSQRGAPETYEVAAAAFAELKECCSNICQKDSSASLVSIYRLLSSLAGESNFNEEAIQWMSELRNFPRAIVGSEASQCFIIARMTALVLRRPLRNTEDEEFLLKLLENLEHPFKGESSEIEDLLVEVSSARRAALSILTRAPSSAKANNQITEGLRQMLESLVFSCPKLCLRYIGKTLSESASTKEIVRYEQRRLFIAKSGLHSVDSAIYLVKLLLSEERLNWDLLDSKLQDCLLLLDRLDLSFGSTPQENQSAPPSYYVRVSNLYYTHFLNERRVTHSPKHTQQLKILRRSVDCVRGRAQDEKKSALFTIKLERMAEICRDCGRYDELFEILVNLRDEMISQGVLSAIAVNAASQPLSSAWSQNDETSMLARTVQTTLKVQVKYLDSTTQASLFDDTWSDEERAVLLEYLLRLLSGQTKQSQATSKLQITISRSLLSLYNRNDYPIRRLRLLILLSSLDMPDQKDILDSVRDELQVEKVATCTAEGTQDEALKNYLVHFQALASSTHELQQDRPRSDVFQECCASWSCLLKKGADVKTIHQHIDDIGGLLDHLQSVADYFSLKGLATSRIRVLSLMADLSELIQATSNPDDLVLSLTVLGSQWLELGYSGKAGMVLDKAYSWSSQNGVSTLALLQLHLANSEYLLAIGNSEKCEEYILRAEALHSREKESRSAAKTGLTVLEKTKRNILSSNAYLLHSRLALDRGAAHVALNFAKQTVRLLRRAWANTEEQLRRGSPFPDGRSQLEVEKLTEDVSQLSISTTTIRIDFSSGQASHGSCFWSLIVPLFRSLNHLSEIYAHHGMFQETIYYAEQGYKLVKEAGSEGHQALAAALMGSILLKAGALDRGSELLMEAKSLSSALEKGRDAAILTYYLGKMQGLLGDPNAEVVAYEAAELVLDGLVTAEYIASIDKITDATDVLQNSMSALTLSSGKATSRRKAPPRPKTTARNKKVVARTNSPVQAASSISEECCQLMSLKASILRGKALVLLSLGKCDQSVFLLSEAGIAIATQIEAVHHRLAMARQLLIQSMDQMTADPVYSVLQDSTISFPSVMGASKSEKTGDRLSLSLSRTSPPRKLPTMRATREIRCKSPMPVGFFDKLVQAQEYLIEAHAAAVIVAPLGLIHHISAVLNNVSILLSAAGQTRGKSSIHPGVACSTIETARTLAIRRERKAILADPSSAIKLDDSCWPTNTTMEARRSSLGSPQDLSRFQKDYIDIIPNEWTAISMSLSDNRNELSITKMQAGCSPFILRLPLGRNNSMDADEEVFGFEQGHSELLEIIQLANESAHDARDMTGREAKMAWWEERESLDSRLRDLLENIEKVWLGGFTGIFSQHTRRPELLARFQRSFQNILDKHLPSRQKVGKRNSKPRVNLDSRILGLFIGLGDASAEDCDFSEPLTDLLYFVVDVLQFHGELNAYAEIDFDSILIETQDALCCYHEAVHASNQPEEGRHTILILDKSLQALPWESLPCMQGQAVSRLPSLGCLRDRIIQQQNRNDADSEQYFVNSESGSYILNPGGDLKNTQATFQKSLQNLTGWDGINKREPTEDEIKESLRTKDMFLYFGHGSGAQYIRAKEIRKLDQCAVTFLMGCSSGSLTEVGEFEPYGPAINYMHGGCPALVATLWDVTDKDIDRFAKSTFEHWGLFEVSENGDGKKGRGKKRVETVVPGEKMSLVEAVAKGRGACNLRYLNAAAVCVYGVPVYLK